MDERIFYFAIAVAIVSGILLDSFFGREMHNWNDPSTRAATERTLRIIGEAGAMKRIDDAINNFEDVEPPEDYSSDESE
jgi:hypothetical protein